MIPPAPLSGAATTPNGPPRRRHDPERPSQAPPRPQTALPGAATTPNGPPRRRHDPERPSQAPPRPRTALSGKEMAGYEIRKYPDLACKLPQSYHDNLEDFFPGEDFLSLECTNLS